MKKYISIFIIMALLSSCEIFTIGSPHQKQHIDISQNSAIGAVYLFKTELDSQNVRAATRLLVPEAGASYLAIDKYEMYFEIARVGRLIASQPITEVIADTLSDHQHKINVQFDYLRTFTFTTEKIDSNWFIVNYQDNGYIY
jgi:hypothetical protein